MQMPSLGWEDPLQKVKATHSSILTWRTPMDRGAWQATVYRVAKSQTQLKRLSMKARFLAGLGCSAIDRSPVCGTD